MSFWEYPDTLGCLMQKYLRFYWKAFPSPVHVLWKWDKKYRHDKIQTAQCFIFFLFPWVRPGQRHQGEIHPKPEQCTTVLASPGVLLLILCLTNTTLTTKGFHRFVIQTTAVLCASFCGELFSWEQHLKWCSRWAIDVIMTFTIL